MRRREGDREYVSVRTAVARLRPGTESIAALPLAGGSLTPQGVLHLQPLVGNAAVGALLAQRCGDTPCDCAGRRSKERDHGGYLADHRDVPAATFDDCPTDWQAVAQARIVTAQGWVSTALENVSSAGRAGAEYLIDRHFHTSDDSIISEVYGNFVKIQGALGSDITYECETSCSENELGYMRWLGSHIHLCPAWHNAGETVQTNTIIHELAHKVAGADDEAYCQDADYATLTASTAADNADSYSNFAQEGATGYWCV